LSEEYLIFQKRIDEIEQGLVQLRKAIHAMQVSIGNQNEVLALLHPERLKRLANMIPDEVIEDLDAIEFKVFELARNVENIGKMLNELTEARTKRDRQVEALLFLHGLTGE
jgi:prefoldin subunit 5